MSNNTLTIDILSDVVCPWCAIGYYRLSAAINKLGMKDAVDIRWHPFELNPNMPSSGENLRQHLANKYGTTLQGSIEARKRLTALGAEVGFTFSYYDEMKMYNTRKAHLLLQWAAESGKQTALSEALFADYFGNRKDISATDTLLDAVSAVGLDPQSAEKVLQSSVAEQQLIELEQKWLSSGFRGVPVMIFEASQALTGAQDVDAYVRTLKDMSHAQAV